MNFIYFNINDYEQIRSACHNAGFEDSEHDKRYFDPWLDINCDKL